MKAAYYLFISWGSFIEMARQGARRRGGAYLHTCQRGQGHYEAQLAACLHNCSSQHAHSSPRIAAVTHLGFQIFCTQSTINNELKIKIVRSTARYSWWQHWGLGHCRADDGGRGEVIRHQAPGGIINCLPSWLSYSCPRVTTPDWARREGGIGVLSDG